MGYQGKGGNEADEVREAWERYEANVEEEREAELSMAAADSSLVSTLASLVLEVLPIRCMKDLDKMLLMHE